MLLVAAVLVVMGAIVSLFINRWWPLVDGAIAAGLFVAADLVRNSN